MFLHPSPINLAANGKCPWTWAYDDLLNLVSNPSASLCVCGGFLHGPLVAGEKGLTAYS